MKYTEEYLEEIRLLSEEENDLYREVGIKIFKNLQKQDAGIAHQMQMMVLKLITYHNHFRNVI